jgi:hypothetical protein
MRAPMTTTARIHFIILSAPRLIQDQSFATPSGGLHYTNRAMHTHNFGKGSQPAKLCPMPLGFGNGPFRTESMLTRISADASTVL